MAGWQAQLGDAQVVAVKGAIGRDNGIGGHGEFARLDDHDGGQREGCSAREALGNGGQGCGQGRALVEVLAIHGDVEGARNGQRYKGQPLVLWIWQASEGLEATARHAIYGVQWRRLDRELLGLLQDRSRV